MISLSPDVGKRPEDGFREYNPQNDAGMRTEPPTSVPTPKGDPHRASNALSPPDEPPLDKLRLYGLVV
jgi:hypothetical protein